jgi:hypothetical protein
VIGVLGYGRYSDDPEHVGCPRARTDMTPCVARDGAPALYDEGLCVGCSADPRELLLKLRAKVSGSSGARVTHADRAADKLRDLVRRTTEPEDGAS